MTSATRIVKSLLTWLYACWVISMLLFSSAVFFFKFLWLHDDRFSKTSFRNIFRVANGLNPEQNRIQTVCKHYQQIHITKIAGWWWKVKWSTLTLGTYGKHVPSKYHGFNFNGNWKTNFSRLVLLKRIGNIWSCHKVRQIQPRIIMRFPTMW